MFQTQRVRDFNQQSYYCVESQPSHQHHSWQQAAVQQENPIQTICLVPNSNRSRKRMKLKVDIGLMWTENQKLSQVFGTLNFLKNCANVRKKISDALILFQHT